MDALEDLYNSRRLVLKGRTAAHPTGTVEIIPRQPLQERLVSLIKEASTALEMPSIILAAMPQNRDSNADRRFPKTHILSAKDYRWW